MIPPIFFELLRGETARATPLPSINVFFNTHAVSLLPPMTTLLLRTLPTLPRK